MMISLDNGIHYTTAHDAMKEINERSLWEAIVNVMDDETREEVAAEIAPCTDEEFLTAYLDNATCDLVIG